jgi:hypothetical protein
MLALSVAVVAMTGCFRMTVKNGLPVGRAPMEYDGKWHSGLIYGIATERYRPVRRGQLSPG